MDEWFCEIAGREIGPLSSHQLKTMAAQGQLLPTDSVRRGATGHWAAASRVRGLFVAGQEPPRAAVEPPSFFGSSPPPAQGFADVPAPNVAWPTEMPTAQAPPEAPVPPPPPAPPIPDVTADDSAPFDVFAESAGHTAARHAAINLALLARAKRKRQQQILMAGSLIFVIFGLAVAALFLAAGNFTGLAEVENDLKQAGGLSRLSKTLEKAAAQPADENSEKLSKRKSAERPESAKSTKPKDDDKPADAALPKMVVGDVPVRLVSLVRGGNRAGTADGQCLLVTVEVKNPNAHDKLEFPGWSREGGLRGATLTDDQGKTYQAKSVDAAAVLGTSPPSSIAPGESARDVLAFELPDSKVQTLQLELPGAAFGQNATASFQIPATMIADTPVVVKLAPAASSAAGPDSKTGSKPKKRSKAKPGTPEYDFGLDEEETPR